MTVEELINKLLGFAADAEVVIVHAEWELKKVKLDEKTNKVKLN